ncbi:MAG: quinone oxidoreductase [Caulobacteraceae bacterium]|nr:quinone oxidoreductase [Caulobacteraceae bacterium]
MRAIQADRIESLADYAEVDTTAPEPRAGQVRIKVAAVGVGYVDALVALGRYQVKPPTPHIPGAELAGVVDAVGDGVDGLAVGQRVAALGARAFAQFAVAPAATTIVLPPNLTFEQGAALPLNGLTALHGLADRGAVRSGETLLVLGAAGGVGIAAVQVGGVLGARVIAAASTAEKRAFALDHGADAAIDTVPEGWRERLKTILGGARLNLVFDPVCGPLFEPAFRSLGWGGRHLVAGFVGGPIPALGANLTLMKGAALTGVDVRQFMLFEAPRARTHLQTLAAWCADGRLSPAVGRVFAWPRFGEALTFALGGQGLGKTVLRVDDG